MTISELNQYIQANNLSTIVMDGIEKYYIPYTADANSNNTVDRYNAFGIYQNQANKYCFFITGIYHSHFASFDTEDEACEALLKAAERAKKRYR